MSLFDQQPPEGSTLWRPRTPCRVCPLDYKRLAYMTVVNGQQVVRCIECGRAIYNAPKDEVGEVRL